MPDLMPTFLPGLDFGLNAATVLWFVLANHVAYLAILFARAVRASRADVEESFLGIAHLAAAYTTFIWGPFVAAAAAARAVMTPLRLKVEWGALHLSANDRPTKSRGRFMRRVVPWFPWLTVGTFSTYKWHKPSDRAGTQTNRLLEVGFRRFGICVIRLGEIVGDVDRQPGPDADPTVEHPYRPADDGAVTGSAA